MAIIYFDQRVWIDLLKSHKGIKGYEHLQDIYNIVLKSSQERNHIFPLSFYHLIETQKRKKKESMEELFEFIFTITHLNSIRPFASIYHLEVNLAISKQLGLETIDLKPFIFGWGIGHCFDSKEEILDKETGKQVSKEMREEILTKAYNPKLLAKVLSSQDFNEPIENIKLEDERLAKNLEIARIKEYSHPDKRKRKDIDDARFLTTTMQKYILEGIRSYTIRKINPKQFMDNVFSSKESALSFLQDIPSAYVFHILNYARNNNKSRSIKPNDLYDLGALSLAIPYCDIVVTEREWANILIQKGIDKLYNTKIIYDISKLKGLL